MNNEASNLQLQICSYLRASRKGLSQKGSSFSKDPEPLTGVAHKRHSQAVAAVQMPQKSHLKDRLTINAT
jgi:hypothetical protein